MATTKSFFTNIWDKKFTFLFVYFLVFFFTYLILVAIDFVPEPKSDSNTNGVVEESAVAVAGETLVGQSPKEEIVPVETIEVEDEVPAFPTQIHIKKIDKTIEVLNPTSRSIADLDEALLSGVVRHPDSAHLAQEGNVFILGHSSYLPNVFNDNYQAFNGIQSLEWGDTIEIFSGDQVFVYRVEKVFEAKAQELTVPIAVDDKLLTLATCNSFGSVDDRYIVEARRVEVKKT